MKKFISLLLSALMLAVPVYGSEVYSQEQLIQKAKDVCQISSDSLDFEIMSTYVESDIQFYSCMWKDKKEDGSINIVIGSDGVLYSYNNYMNGDTDKSMVYTDKEAREKAESFLKNALGEKYNNIEFYAVDGRDDTYRFSYLIKYNNIAYLDTFARITVDKYSNSVIHYSYPEHLTAIKNSSFEGLKTADEAEKIVKNNMELGYLADYDYEKEEYNVKLIYRLKDYLLKADNLEPLSNGDIAVFKDGTMEAGSGSAEPDALSPSEIKGIEDINNAISLDEAIKAYNNLFGQKISKSDVNAYYEKEYISDNYYVVLNSVNPENYFSATVDHKGRVTAYNRKYETGEKNVTLEKAKANAEAFIKKLNRDYEFTAVEGGMGFYDTYNLECNVVRNGKISFNETVNISVDTDGNITSMYTNYLPDDIFDLDIKAEINADKAYNIIKEKYDFKPYFNIKSEYTGVGENYESIPVYGFNEQFSVDAVSGEILNYYGNEIEDNSIKTYTDIDNQWYAEAAVKLAYMGIAFDGNEFKGDDVLTLGGLKELDNYRYFNDFDGDESDDRVLTRYDFAEILIGYANFSGIDKYNEIFIKPFDDVDFQHTATVAILKAMGVVGGESFRGDDNITRGEAATMLYRFIVNN